MRTSEEHLERALAEYNDKVGRLEENGTPEELLEAYVNRGCVLSMLGSRISAVGDFDDAADIIGALEDRGKKVDAGLFVKVFLSRGALLGENEEGAMAGDYSTAAARLADVNEGSRFFDRRSLIDECVNCAEDLLDAGMPGLSGPFTEKAAELLRGHGDRWSQNRYVEVCSERGQAFIAQGKYRDAAEAFRQAVERGKDLFRGGKLDDPEVLIFAYLSKGDAEKDLNDTAMFFEDREKAISLMEELFGDQRFDDPELLSELHGEIAKAYMEKGLMDRAEAHLMKQVALNLNGARDYIEENGPGHKDRR